MSFFSHFPVPISPQIISINTVRNNPSTHIQNVTCLFQVFTALRKGQLHVPYRNSKLTHILQPSLGGDAKVRVTPDFPFYCDVTPYLLGGSATMLLLHLPGICL